MDNLPTVEERVKTAATKVFTPPDDLSRETTLKSLGLDSLDHVEFVMTLEDEFDFTIPDDVAEQWTTYGDVVAFVENSG